MLESTVDLSLMELLQSRFNIIATIEFLDFDHDYSVLEKWIQDHRQDSYAADDRFVFTHFDTDYYINNQYGVTLHNLFTIWERNNIPFYTMLINTNHFGISQEIDQILRFHSEQDRPTVIETLLNRIHYPDQAYDQADLAVDDIEYHALCLCAGSRRSHRQALYSHLQHIPASKLAMTIRKTA